MKKKIEGKKNERKVMREGKEKDKERKVKREGKEKGKKSE